VYVPAFSSIDVATARGVVAEVGSGWLVTNAADGPPSATLMPVLWRGDVLIAHMAKANPHWRAIGDGAPGLVIVTGAQAYISPSWYASKLEHGRVVPTWNYLAVHLSGQVSVHLDPDWLRAAVTDLTERHEHARPERWHVADAPGEYIASQLKAIVGIEMQVERVEGKAKLSQNRSAADRAGVLDGLEAVGDPASSAIASAMRSGETDIAAD
jgi:transcriptional regulator